VRRLGVIVVVKSAPETEGVVVIDVIRAVVVVGGNAFQEKCSLFVGQRLLEARGLFARRGAGLGWMRVETTQFRIGVARASVREGAGGSPLAEDTDRDGMEGDGLP